MEVGVLLKQDLKLNDISSETIVFAPVVVQQYVTLLGLPLTLLM